MQTKPHSVRNRVECTMRLILLIFPRWARRAHRGKIRRIRRMVHSTRFRTLCGLVCIAGSALPRAASAADADASALPSNPATAQELQQVIVIGNAPLPGLG